MAGGATPLGTRGGWGLRLPPRSQLALGLLCGLLALGGLAIELAGSRPAAQLPPAVRPAKSFHEVPVELDDRVFPVQGEASPFDGSNRHDGPVRAPSFDLWGAPPQLRWLSPERP